MERTIAVAVLAASFLGLGTVAVVTNQDTPEHYGDGCFSTSTEFVACADTAYTPDMSTVLELCPTEDSDNCYWNAVLQGNGTGKSFISINGEVRYL